MRKDEAKNFLLIVLPRHCLLKVGIAILKALRLNQDFLEIDDIGFMAGVISQHIKYPSKKASSSDAFLELNKGQLML